MKLLLINGPNLNLLGYREADIYGLLTLDEIVQQTHNQASEMGIELTSVQSNSEGELIDAVHQAKEDGVDVILINPGAYTHTSIALRDAFLGVDIPFIEVHMSNVHSREPFRQVSYLSDIAIGTITGMGEVSYMLGLLAAVIYGKDEDEDFELPDINVH